MAERFKSTAFGGGYNKEQVDHAMEENEQTISLLREQIRNYDDRILNLEAELAKEKAKKDTNNKNSFASLGANAQALLASAEQTSVELLNRAKADANTIKESATHESETLLNNAKNRL